MKNTYHELTKHSFVSVREHPNYLDWSKQPTPFKIYQNYLNKTPLDLNKEFDRFIYLLGGINAKKVYPGVEYYLRVIPSAGALYPVEIYFQSRGVKELEDGIYHYDIASNSIVLLYKIEKNEGVEFFFKDKREVKGFIFLYSSIYYRSSWKYKNRAFRYTLLDTGHALGALEVSSYLYNHAYFIRFDFDKKRLNDIFGFKDQEFFLGSANVGVFNKKRVEKFNMRLDFVDGSRFFEKNSLINDAYLKTLNLKNCKKNYRYPKLSFLKEKLYEAVLHRRSIRDFNKESIKKEEFEFILNYMSDFVPNDCDEEIKIYYIVNRVKNMQKGLYLKDKIIKNGDFSEKAKYLCLEQDLAKDSSVTFFLTSSGKNYQPLYQKAGLIGHRCYIASSYIQIGCSGIGAFYDDDVKDFLNIDDMILYALAIGK
ncbi:SagB family peptide dehydrogenase [Nitrosophilus kaiyonis]|uniref:SagB family peptide dehydrogenase n=1 Tax=Nitrosophilus kaiyonis TaxID=2930200 RepID=UPI002492E1FE|nr:SagB family peptide dehydrogenase [Nitrosophilus kaiyonis]